MRKRKIEKQETKEKVENKRIKEKVKRINTMILFRTEIKEKYRKLNL